MYAPLALGGEHRGVRLVDAATISDLAAVGSASAVDAVLFAGMRFGLGFVKSCDNRRGPAERDSMILSEEAFGHPGMGGSVGFADPRARLSFGYTMNRQGHGVLLNERGQSLVDAAYRRWAIAAIPAAGGFDGIQFGKLSTRIRRRPHLPGPGRGPACDSVRPACDLVFNVGQGAGTSDLLKLAGALGVINKGDLELVARQSLRLDIDRRRTAGLDGALRGIGKDRQRPWRRGTGPALLEGCFLAAPTQHQGERTGRLNAAHEVAKLF